MIKNIINEYKGISIYDDKFSYSYTDLLKKVNDFNYLLKTKFKKKIS